MYSCWGLQAEKNPVNMLFSWFVQLLFKKKIHKTSPSLLSTQLAPFNRNGTVCPCLCKQAAAQPTPSVHLGHSMSYNKGVPVSRVLPYNALCTCYWYKGLRRNIPLPHSPIQPSCSTPYCHFDQITKSVRNFLSYFHFPFLCSRSKSYLLAAWFIFESYMQSSAGAFIRGCAERATRNLTVLTLCTKLVHGLATSKQPQDWNISHEFLALSPTKMH